jgi:hypothetical protein
MGSEILALLPMQGATGRDHAKGQIAGVQKSPSRAIGQELMHRVPRPGTTPTSLGHRR